MKIFPRFLFGLAITGGALARAQSSDPQLNSWVTSTSRSYARVWQSAAAKSSNSTSLTWPTSGTTNGGQTKPAYTDIARVLYSTSYVYIYTTGLPSWTMGPWSVGFPNWPSDRNGLSRFPRAPSIPATKTNVQGPSIPVAATTVNGMAFFNCLDGQSYSATTGQVTFNGDRVWQRTAVAGEASTMDMNNAHQENTGTYHSHHNPIGLRYLLGDHVTYNASTGTYSEATNAVTTHSPILAWAADGLPIYGPYGYSSPLDTKSGVRRMVSGFQVRDGTNGTTSLAATGRTTLPSWSTAASNNRSTTLTSSQYGPNVSTAYPLGTFGEDYDYLGDHGKTQGVDFDLNQYNARFCVTPEFPNGTWAYFTALDASNNAAFPYILAYQFVGSVPSVVTSITETVTEYTRAGQASAITANVANNNGMVTLMWTSVEGATYKVETSADNSAFATLNSAVTSAGGATTALSTATVANYYRVTLTALAAYDTDGTGGVSGAGTTATATLAPAATIPGVTTQPASQTATAGASVTFTVAASATGATSYQWSKNGVAIGGATDASYTIASAQTTDAGSYTVTVSTSAGATTSNAATLTVNAASTTPTTATNTAHLVNLATRVQIGGSAGTPILGFVTSGTGSKKLIVRAVGPGLAAFGFTGTVADPSLTLVSGSTTIASNDNWNSGDAATIAAAGAFPLTVGSKDAVIVSTNPAGPYSAVVGAGGGSGLALLEIYDGDTTSPATLVNASTRAFVGTGDSVLIPGLVIAGSGTMKLLVRVVGPTLALFNVPGALADPQVTLYSGSTAIASNDNWSSASNATDIAAATAQAGTFALASGSKDAVLLVSLAAGAYTAVVSGVGDTTGTALIEIYVVQ